MSDFFPIEIPYNTEDFNLFKEIINQGIDSSLEGFTKSEFGEAPVFKNKFRFNFHRSEMPILLRRLDDYFNKTNDENALSWADDIRDSLNDEKQEKSINEITVRKRIRKEIEQMFNENLEYVQEQLQDVDITEDLRNFDLNNLDIFEMRQYDHFIKQSSKEEVLQILINSVEGDFSQLSPELANLAMKQKAR